MVIFFNMHNFSLFSIKVGHHKLRGTAIDVENISLLLKGIPETSGGPYLDKTPSSSEFFAQFP